MPFMSQASRVSSRAAPWRTEQKIAGFVGGSLHAAESAVVAPKDAQQHHLGKERVPLHANEHSAPGLEKAADCMELLGNF